MGLCLIAAPLALGGAHPSVNAALAAVLVLVLLVVVARSARERVLILNLPVLTVLGALAFTLLQLLPLPLSILAALSPRAHDLVRLDAAVRFAPLSLDPPATAHEVVKLVALSAAALLSLRLFGEGRRRRELVAWIVAAGGAVVALGLLHGLFRWQRPYDAFGLPHDVFVSSFVNPNHLAAFVGMSAILALGLAIGADGRRRVAWLVVGILCGAATVLSLSRGGTLSLIGALGVLALFLKLRRSSGRGLILVQVGVLGALLVAAWLAYSQVVHELWTLGGERALAKADIWKPVPAMIADFWPFGIGRGAFFAIYPHYLSGPVQFTFTHLENEWLQVLVDFGVPAGGALLLAIVAAMGLAFRRAEGEPLALAALAALVFLGVHNVGDFNLELLALSLPAVMILTTAVGRPQALRRRTRRSDVATASRLALKSSKALCLGGGLAVVLLATLPFALPFEVGRDTARLRELLSHIEANDATLSQAAAIVARHPADYLQPLLVAEALVQQKGRAKEALHWINRGLYLNPHYAGGHRLAARALLQLGAREQALLEYRMCARAAPHKAIGVATEVWNTLHDAKAVAQLGIGSDVLKRDFATFLLQRHAPEEALTLLGSPGESTPVELQVLRVQALSQAGRLSQADREAAGLEVRFPYEPKVYLARAEALKAAGQLADSISVLELGLSRLPHQPLLLLARAHAGLAGRDAKTARDMAQALLEHTTEPAMQSQAQWLMGRSYALEGRIALALRHFERARDLYPATLHYRLAIASARCTIGDWVGAVRELKRAQAELGTSPPLEEALKRAEASAVQSPRKVQEQLLK